MSEPAVGKPAAGKPASEPRRFGLDAIDAERAKLDAAKDAAKNEDKRSTARLVALTNLPWLIAFVAWLIWKYL
ncbi:hypothetical protein [Andreprevotia chitinilytica]|uniref:hypothetical protein n=1 Tax=Andreprevotia chitinilytica TaxID=396808 RepID=UPI0012EBD055|nr:hypothetical protein [Andreprevotia chitinilytica]